MLTIVTVSTGLHFHLSATAYSFSKVECPFTWLVKVKGPITSADFECLDKFPGQSKIICSDDNGIYGAMNEALSEVETEYVLFLGAGDTWVNGADQKLGETVRSFRTKGIDVAFFPVITDDKSSVWIPDPKVMPERMSCPHPGTICRTDLIRKIGGFDERYLIAADYDLISRIIKDHSPTIGIGSFPLFRLEPGGVSKTNFVEAFLETQLIRCRVWDKDMASLAAGLHGFISLYARPQIL